MVAELDDIDRKILGSLNANARKSYRDMAKELGVALSTVSHHVHKLEESGVIRGYVPLLDEAALGYELAALIGVRIAHGKLLEVQGRIAKHPRAFGVYDVTGDWDSLVLARFRDRAELNAFIKEVVSLEHVERTSTQLVLNTVKEDRRVLVP